MYYPLIMSMNKQIALLLDLFPNAQVGFSLRKLRTDYLGSAIRVRRSSDNAEQDFGFVGNNLDTSSLLTFCGVGNGFVTTWYDQSGSSNNGVMNTALNQCQVVLNGNLILDPNTNKITTIWGTKFYNFPIPFISPNTQYLTLGVINRIATNNIFVSMGNVGTLGTANGQCPVLWRANGNVDSAMQSLVTHGTTTTIGAYLITSEKNSANLKTIYLNNLALATTSIEAPSTGTNLFYFGRQGANYTSGRVAEFIHYNSDQSTNRIGIQNNINNYWNIY